MTPLDPLLARTESLLASDRLTEPTRVALWARLDRRYGMPRVLGAVQMQTLKAASARLIPTPELAGIVDLAGAFDAKLAAGEGDGWRYAEAPPDRQLHSLGLDALDAAARARLGAAFCDLSPERQDALLAAAASGELDFGGLNAAVWFEELLSALVELHYAHPLVQVSIGYDGMADAGGVQAVSLAEVAQGPSLVD
jgi:gluconate 2-dehydrogenase gamma chain